jgi:hypothetical protein
MQGWLVNWKSCRGNSWIIKRRKHMTEEPKANLNIGLTDESIKGITSAVNDLSKTFGDIYARLNYAGFVSIFGAILVFLPLFLGKLPLFDLTTEERTLYVFVGTVFVTMGAAWIAIHNVIIYKHQKVKQEIACRMLAIKVAAMGETQRSQSNW